MIKSDANPLAESDEFKDTVLIPPTAGYRPLRKTDDKGEILNKIVNGSLMGNLLYSKEKLSNIQKIIDNFLVIEKK